MNNIEAFKFIKEYFHELFENKNISAIDKYMTDEYWDDDIGDKTINHKEASKNYLINMFKNNPGINVTVKKAQIENDVISAFLEWSQKEKNELKIIRKGIGIFEIKNMKIVKRHTYIYFRNL